MKTTSVTVGIPVRNLTRGRQWYERVFELVGPDLEPVEGVVEYEIGSCWDSVWRSTAARLAGIQAKTQG